MPGRNQICLERKNTQNQQFSQYFHHFLAKILQKPARLTKNFGRLRRKTWDYEESSQFSPLTVEFWCYFDQIRAEKCEIHQNFPQNRRFFKVGSWQEIQGNLKKNYVLG